MSEFFGMDFLLEGETAKRLFHEYASTAPIIDYHCHIDPSEIYENRRFADISDAWLGGDHYKWRLMRACGVDEKYITGAAAGIEKFRALARILPRAIGNPVYHWVHLELQRYFGCRIPLGPDTADEIWNLCNEKLAQDDSLRVRGIIGRSNVECIITTDSPADDLTWHRRLADDETFGTKVLPGWRPDAVMNIENAGFAEEIRKLSEAANIGIYDYASLKAALLSRLEYFNNHGCRASDHGLRRLVPIPSTDEDINALLAKRFRGEIPSMVDADRYRYALLCFLAKEYARLGWVMELHLGALRNVNADMYGKLGADSGFDSIDPSGSIPGLAIFLDVLNSDGLLPKTLIFSIEPSDNIAINTLAGCFTQPGLKSKVQQGSAWWFNDSCAGIRQQLTSFAESGVLANFIGMLTDSRSFLSYTRHEYFRHILCSLIGGWVDTGLYPSDTNSLAAIVQDICYNNAKEYFGV